MKKVNETSQREAKKAARLQRILQRFKKHSESLDIHTREKKICLTLPYYESLADAEKVDLLILRQNYGYYIQYKFFNL